MLAFKVSIRMLAFVLNLLVERRSDEPEGRAQLHRSEPVGRASSDLTSSLFVLTCVSDNRLDFLRLMRYWLTEDIRVKGVLP